MVSELWQEAQYPLHPISGFVLHKLWAVGFVQMAYVETTETHFCKIIQSLSAHFSLALLLAHMPVPNRIMACGSSPGWGKDFERTHTPNNYLWVENDRWKGRKK